MNQLPDVCPRDGGTMLPKQRDPFGEFRVCLSCGYYADRLLEPGIGKQPRKVGVRPKRKQKEQRR